MRVAIVGAGAAGLTSAKNSIENGFSCDVFEMRPQLGGTWLYTDDIDEDEYGFPVYSATYKSLKANVPKEIMGFPDFPLTSDYFTYPTHEELKRFLNDYADKYNLKHLIKFNTLVIKIRPIEDDKWSLIYKDKITKEEFKRTYDAVMLCTGNYNKGNIPVMPGAENFQGEQYHSRQYRTPGKFKGKNVLVIGAGPSGADLALELSSTAREVFMSNHSKVLTSKYPGNVTRKPDVEMIRERDVVFVDGSSDEIDVIFYATGFKYSYPYLHESCGVHVDEDNCVAPLYKHLIHMERPTMCIVGIPVQVCAFPLFDLQSRFFVKHLKGEVKLPSSDEMRLENELEMEMRKLRCDRKRWHSMGVYQQVYYDDLAGIAGIETIPPVLSRVRDHSFDRFYKDLRCFREDRYEILDDKNFVHIPAGGEK